MSRTKTNGAITVLSLGMVFFHLYTAARGVLPAVEQRGVHLAFALTIAALYDLKKSDWPLGKTINLVRIVAPGVIVFYLLYNFHSIMERFGIPSGPDMAAGIALILLVLEFTRRITGPVLMGIALVFLVYAFAGPWLPGMLWHRGYDLERLVTQISLSTEGIFGTPLGVSANYVFLFVIFGSLLDITGIGQFYIDVAMRAVGKSCGGAAKAAIVASSCFGTISGSAVANVMGTGSITIPLMKSLGYTSAFSGAVEAVASTGGQIMPPMMGAGAYIMAEILGIPFRSVILAALLPAVIFYCTLFVTVHFTAKRQQLVGADTSELPGLPEMFKKKGLCIAPLVVLIAMLVFLRVSVIKAAVWAIFTTLAVGLFYSRRDLKHYALGLKDAFINGARTALVVIASTACAGIVVAVINLTGIGMKFTGIILAIAGGNLFLVLFFIMLASMLIGMGLPTTPAYLILAVLGAPTLVRLGVVPIAAHLFVFYFSCLSMITPPVALAVYAASGLAKANFWRTGIEACKLGLTAFFIPYVFVYDPILIWQGPLWHIFLSALTAILGSIGIGAGICGWFFRKTFVWERIVLIISGFLLILPNIIFSVIGFVLLVAVYSWQKRSLKTI
ncbi:MAG: TRAP transporter permease [Synergistaceae bacterium]|jgi:TRAP transporter 4TM/12TM fusion protein|nr:TRAP transporter permease [Synergistaceae bacterium]